MVPCKGTDDPTQREEVATRPGAWPFALLGNARQLPAEELQVPLVKNSSPSISLESMWFIVLLNLRAIDLWDVTHPVNVGHTA